MIRNITSRNNVQAIKVFEGVYRKTLLYNKQLMLCHFTLEKNANIPLHTHKEHQIGYVIKGKLQFITEEGEFIAKGGDSYIFDSNEKHGAVVLEDSEVIDVFNPAREDYK
ncbi:MAG: cupin domain-containing protein [Candidatus Lokiarchaeota archaeon]|nr:cupin domain-containing protein [Candidatus Lokiarchaeota archaeon]